MRKMHAWLILAVLLILCGTAFAVQAAAPAAPPSGGVPAFPFKLGGGVLAGVLTGIWGAVWTVLAGLLKSKDPKTGTQEGLDIGKAWETLLIGVILGGVGGAFKLAPADTVSFLTGTPMGAGLVAYAEMAWNAVFRQTAGLVQKTLDLFKIGQAK